MLTQVMIFKAYDNQYLADRIRELFPDLKGRIVIGEPGKWPGIDGPNNTLDPTKASKVLEMTCECQ